jgi:hypothetical protein
MTERAFSPFQTRSKRAANAQQTRSKLANHAKSLKTLKSSIRADHVAKPLQ